MAAVYLRTGAGMTTEVMKRGPGQPTKLLKPGVKERVLEYISKGNYIQTACLAAGIHPGTFGNWVRWAEEYELSPGNGNESKKIFFEFFTELKNAEAKAEAAILARIDEAGKYPQYWASNAFRLERKSPERWGRRDVLEVGPSKVLIQLQEQMRELKYSPKLIEG